EARGPAWREALLKRNAHLVSPDEHTEAARRDTAFGEEIPAPEPMATRELEAADVAILAARAIVTARQARREEQVDARRERLAQPELHAVAVAVRHRGVIGNEPARVRVHLEGTLLRPLMGLRERHGRIAVAVERRKRKLHTEEREELLIAILDIG